MTRSEIERLLGVLIHQSDGKIHDGFWLFCEVMGDRQYGQPMLITAWAWFSYGWAARGYSGGDENAK